MKKNFALIVGIALPIIFIGILLVVVAGPSFFLKPQHNFLYTADTNIGSGYSYPYTVYKNKYAVVKGQLVLQPFSFATSTIKNVPTPVPIGEYPNAVVQDAPTLFLYNVTDNTSHEITAVDAAKLYLDAGPTSADGFIVQYSYNNDGVFGIFGGGSGGPQYYISKGDNGKRLTRLGLGQNGYPNNFQFLAWINNK